METPCPPFYSEPTHEVTILFSTSSYARNTNDWYQCIEAAYCNAPSFLGYNPPGEGYLWQKAWKRLASGYPCNTALETSTTGFLPTEDEEIAAENEVNNQFLTGNTPIIATPRPTSRPTTIEETPSLISGVVWYDANGDGRQNSPLDSLTQMDHDASMSERGAGISNMRMTLRSCSNDALLGVTYTFPRAFGFGSEGNIEIIDSSYIEQVETQVQDSMGYSDVANDGLGIGNTEGKLGYYSFRVLPFQIPGEFYVVFESPEGYRLTGGSGDYWEVYESAMYDMVQPVMEATWRRNENVDGSNNNDYENNRVLQTDVGNDEASTLNATMSANQTTVDISNGGRPQQPKEPINYSGYFARSSCFPIQKSPTQVTNINAGLTEDSWPLVPFQYSSFVVTIRFFSAPGTRRKRRRQRELQPLSLECRKYEKDKADGLNPEDLWGCEQGPSSGGNSLQFDFEKLTLDQGDLVALSVQDFLGSRLPRAWTVKLVSLTHQDMIVLEDEDNKGGGVRRGLLDHLSSPLSNKDERQQQRYLQGNREIANLVLGFRVRAEYTSDKSSENLNKVIADSVTSGAESFLSGVKASVPSYFQLAGAITVRDILWTPPVIKEEEEMTDDGGNIVTFDDDFLGLREETDLANEGEGGISTMGMVIGIVTSSVIILAGIIMLLMYRHRHKKNTKARKKRFALGANMKAAARRRIIGQDDQSFPSYYDSDESDDLSSRFYSDSSNFDPTTRMQEVASMYSESESESESESDISRYEASEARRKAMQRVKGGVRGKFEGLSDGSSYETGSRSYTESKSAASASYYSQSVGDSYATASKSYHSQSQGGSAIYVDEEDISQDVEQSRASASYYSNDASASRAYSQHQSEGGSASYYSNNVSGASRAYSQSQVDSAETDSRRSQTQSQQGDTSYYSNDISGASRSATSHTSAPSRQSGASRSSNGARSRNSGRSMQSGISSGRHSRASRSSAGASRGSSRGSVKSGVSSGRNSRVSRNSKRSMRSSGSGRSGRGSTRSGTRSRMSQASGSEASRSAAMGIIPEDNVQAETTTPQINLFQYSNQFQESQQLGSLDYSLTDEDPYSLTDSYGDTLTRGTNSLEDVKSRSTRGSGKSRSSRGSKSSSVASSRISHESELS